jgi:hypothetical protein
MTGDEIRGLTGGYATGSLSEAERKALFEAALADQELFDELAREHALKELLAQPGTKQRLIAALAPEPKRRHKIWMWAAACAGGVAGVVAMITGIMLMRPAPVQQIARVEVSALPSSPPAVAPAPVAPASRTQTAPKLAAPDQAPAASAAPPNPPSSPIAPPATPIAPPATPIAPPATPIAPPATPIAPPATPIAPPAAAAASLAPPQQSPVVPVPVAPRAFAPAAPPVPSPAPPALPRASESVTVTAEASLQKTDSPPPAPAVQVQIPKPPDPFAASGTVAAGPVAAPPTAQANGALGTGTLPTPAGAARGGGGRGGGGGGRGIGGQRAAAAGAPARFAFDYRLTPEGALRIEPAGPGFLTVEVSDKAGTYAVLFRDRVVAAGSVNEIALPPDAVTAVAILTTQPNPSAEEPVHGVMDPPSGTKSDPNPTPASRLFVEIPVKR